MSRYQYEQIIEASEEVIKNEILDLSWIRSLIYALEDGRMWRSLDFMRHCKVMAELLGLAVLKMTTS